MKVCKGYCHALHGSTLKLVNPDSVVAGEAIFFIGSGSINFLGMRIQVPHDVTVMKEAPPCLARVGRQLESLLESRYHLHTVIR